MILVVGDVMTDVIVRPHGPLVRGSDRAATIRTAPGGSGANQAAWLGHLGGRVTLAGRVGAGDAAAQRAELCRHNVVALLAEDAHLPTGLLVTLLDADGERSFLTERGANTNLCAADLPPTLLEQAALLHVSGYSLFSPGPRAAVLALAADAAARGIPVTVDAGSAGFLAEPGAAAFVEWTDAADTLVANADEAALLAGTPDPGAALARLGASYATVVVKLGAAGAIAATRGAPACRAPAPPVAAIDSTGAGDAFLAAFLLAKLAGAPLQACLDAAVIQGARAATMLGGRPPIGPDPT